MTQAGSGSQVVDVVNATGASPIVFVCEHASAFIPPHLDHLGLACEDRRSHAAWDPGALEIGQRLCKRFDAALVASRISRLVYDCNRPPEAADAMPARSEIIDVPGNTGLTAADRQARTAAYYLPFRDCVTEVLAARQAPILVTLHSFTPIYNGKRRDVEIGVLHDRDSRLADALMESADLMPFDVRRNAPYGPEDGVTHTLKLHGLPQGRLNVMLEIRNDLIAETGQQDAMAGHLAGWLEAALARVTVVGGRA